MHYEYLLINLYYKFLACIILLLSLSYQLSAQDSEIVKASDSIQSYSIGQIVKTADENGQNQVRISTSDILRYRDIQKTDGTSIAEVAPLIPSARLETNSRGETLLYLRNSGERQTALFFDGALLNIPWDNRMDLSFIPAEIIGRMVTDQGSSSVLYGANTMGGALSLSTFERNSDGQTNIISAMGLEGGGYQLSGTSHNRSGKTNIIVHFNTLNSPGILNTSQPNYEVFNRPGNPGLLPNSFQERNTGYIRAETQIGEVKIGLGVLGITGSKGVVPQDNRERRSRYWQYGDWNRLITILNSSYEFDEGSFRTTLWYDDFDQAIDKYEDISYSDIEAIQEDDDRTFGGRAILDLDIADGTLSTSIVGYHSIHGWEETNQPDLTFSQSTFSLGSEYRGIYNNLSYAIGASYDLNITPQTGQFTEDEGNTISDLGFLLGVGYRLTESSDIFANISRKNRFPTMREQYSDADRFIINPDLTPETGILSEFGYRISFENHSISTAAFYNSYNGLIEVEPVLGDDLGRDMRRNIDNAVIPGIEIEADGTFSDISTSYLANLSLMRPRGTSNGSERLLETRPEVIGFLRIDNRSIENLSIMPEIQFNGSQLSYNDGEEVILGFQYRLNLRLAYNLIIESTATEIFARIDNITDQPFLFKIGFPAPGRTLRMGLKSIL
jgi:iron complex outermembrane receptor protein